MSRTFPCIPSPNWILGGVGTEARRPRLDSHKRLGSRWSSGGHDDEEEAAATGRLFSMHLEGDVYSCKHCHTHLGLASDIISKDFLCKSGKAYLFSKVVNVNTGVKEDRMMITGIHTVSDIFCVGCGSIVGWKYEAALEKSQRYKDGKFILERFKVSGPDESHDWVTHDAHVGGSDADEL